MLNLNTVQIKIYIFFYFPEMIWRSLNVLNTKVKKKKKRSDRLKPLKSQTGYIYWLLILFYASNNIHFKCDYHILTLQFCYYCLYVSFFSWNTAIKF